MATLFRPRRFPYCFPYGNLTVSPTVQKLILFTSYRLEGASKDTPIPEVPPLLPPYILARCFPLCCWRTLFSLLSCLLITLTLLTVFLLVCWFSIARFPASLRSLNNLSDVSVFPLFVFFSNLYIYIHIYYRYIHHRALVLATSGSFWPPASSLVSGLWFLASCGLAPPPYPPASSF